MPAPGSKMSSGRIERVFSALQHLQQSEPRGLTLTELAGRLELPPSSTHDLLAGMRAAQLVTVSDGLFRLGSAVIGLALTIASSLDLPSIPAPDAAALSARTSEDVLLGLRAGNTVIYGFKHEGTTPLKVDVRLGQPRPLHATSVGKLFAAYHQDLAAGLIAGRGRLERFTGTTITDRGALRRNLEAIRSLGLAISNQEAIAGVIGIAAPIIAASGDLVLAIHLSLPVQRATADRLAHVVSETRRAAEAASQRFGGSLPEPPSNLVDRAHRYVNLDASAQAGRVSVGPTPVLAS